MKRNDPAGMQWPTVEELEAELRRERKRSRRFLLKGLLLIIALAAIVAIAAAFLWTPVLRVSGNSMAPSLTDGDIVVAYTGSEIQRGDVIAFYYNNKLLIKRVIAVVGDTVNVDAFGGVTINGERLDEPYVSNRALGECSISMPYTVPAGFFFVMGDSRAESLDSRSTAIGCVAHEQILGRVFAQIWPLEEIGWSGREIWEDILN